MHAHLLLICFILNIVSCMYAMETEAVTIHNMHAVLRSSQENLSGQQALGGVAATDHAVDLFQFYDELKELTLLMGVVVDGIVIRDHAILLPGRAFTLPLERASAWINATMDLADKYTSSGKPLVHSDDPNVRECQIAQKRLWEFMQSDDLFGTGLRKKALKKQLHVNRMLRITGIIMQQEEILQKYGRAPVFLPNADTAEPGCCCAGALHRMLTHRIERTKKLKHIIQ